jgi:hypothetical protein
MIETLISVFKSEFFWGIIVGAILTAIGSILIVRLQDRAQRKQRFELVRTFSIDTVKNISQIIRDLHELRNRANAIQLDFLILLETEIGIFGRNREHIIALPPDVRGPLRAFVNNCAIKRAEIGNFLTEFYRQWALADQMESSGQTPEGQRVRANAAAGPLQKANAAADRLHQLLPDADKVLAELESVRARKGPTDAQSPHPNQAVPRHRWLHSACIRTPVQYPRKRYRSTNGQRSS